MRFSSVAALGFVGVLALSGCSTVSTTDDTTVVATRTAQAAPQMITPEPQEFPDGTVASVVEVKNGNTVILNIEGKDREVRLINVLTPNDRNPEISGSCLVNEAAEFTRSVLPAGTEVTLNFDPAAIGTSGYLEAAVYKGEEFVNHSVIAEGFGVATYLSYGDKFYQDLTAAQLQAIENNKGVYSTDVECSIPRMISDKISAVEGAGSLSKDDATSVYREASRLYNDLQHTSSNPASWAGSIVTLEPIRVKLQELMVALGGNYYDQNGVKRSDKESASAAPVRPGQENGAAAQDFASQEAEPTEEPTEEPTYTDEELAEAGAVEANPEGEGQ